MIATSKNPLLSYFVNAQIWPPLTHSTSNFSHQNRSTMSTTHCLLICAQKPKGKALGRKTKTCIGSINLKRFGRNVRDDFHWCTHTTLFRVYIDLIWSFNIVSVLPQWTQSILYPLSVRPEWLLQTSLKRPNPIQK